ncbi:hypothetical protein LTR22_012311 [Elasticomyces elasticus]|nr:hypothetical protein LTR22_012311 [Elasticomyces elasticus]
MRLAILGCGTLETPNNAISAEPHLADDHATKEADVVILAHKPYMLRSVFGEEGMAAALQGKSIISILAGVSSTQIREVLTSLLSATDAADCQIVQAMPNLAALAGESMTLVCESRETRPDLVLLATQIFERVGRVQVVSEALMAPLTVLAGASHALLTVAVDGILDGAVSQGIARAPAKDILVQCLTGLAKMLDCGQHPAQLRESMSSYLVVAAYSVNLAVY